ILTTSDNRHNLMSVFKHALEFFNPIGASDHNDLIDALGFVECIDRMGNERLASKRHGQLIKSQPPTTTGRDDDGSEHGGRDLQRLTLNVQRPTSNSEALRWALSVES